MKYIFLLCFSVSVLQAQIPVEIFAGHQRTTLDLMFFRFFKNKAQENSHWLFFNRNRASIDYRMNGTLYLPQFGFTEAVSYNHPALKGFAPVLVGQVLNTAVLPKAGLQYAKISKNFTLFGWVVSETLKLPDLDFFVLFRFTPPIGKSLHLFTQIESLNSFPMYNNGNFGFTQRLRLGLKIRDWQFGAGYDSAEFGRQSFSFFYNIGGFLRHEF